MLAFADIIFLTLLFPNVLANYSVFTFNLSFRWLYFHTKVLLLFVLCSEGFNNVYEGVSSCRRLFENGRESTCWQWIFARKYIGISLDEIDGHRLGWNLFTILLIIRWNQWPIRAVNQEETGPSHYWVHCSISSFDGSVNTGMYQSLSGRLRCERAWNTVLFCSFRRNQPSHTLVLKAQILEPTSNFRASSCNWLRFDAFRSAFQREGGRGHYPVMKGRGIGRSEGVANGVKKRRGRPLLKIDGHN